MYCLWRCCLDAPRKNNSAADSLYNSWGVRQGVWWVMITMKNKTAIDWCAWCYRYPLGIRPTRTTVKRRKINNENEVLNFFRLLYAIVKIAFTATIISSFSFLFRSSYMIYFIHHYHSILSREHMNPQLTCSQHQWLHSSVSRASHRYHEVTGSNPVEVLNFFFQASLRNCINCIHCDDHFFIFISFPQFI